MKFHIAYRSVEIAAIILAPGLYAIFTIAATLAWDLPGDLCGAYFLASIVAPLLTALGANGLLSIVPTWADGFRA